MRGNTLYQVNRLFEQIKAFGESKYAAKQEFSREAKSGNIIYNAQNLAERTGVYSYKTADSYRAEWRQCLQFAKEHFGVKDIEKVTGEHIKAYLVDKINRTGGNKNTIAHSSSALVKMAVALDKLHNSNSHVKEFRQGIAEAQAGRTLERPEQARAYQDPQALQAHLILEAHRVAAELTADIGMRATELSLITPNQLNEHNQIYYQSKGGQYNIRTLSGELADKLREYFAKDGKFRVNQNDYRLDIKQAALATGQEYQGIHGLRWNFAQVNYDDFKEQGLTHTEACKEVSELMGHHRPDITEHYLRR
jgi:integrase